MKKIITLIAVAMLGISSMMAQTMTLTIEGKEVKNGDNIEVKKLPRETVMPFGTLYELGVEVELTSLISQSVRGEGIDFDHVSPGLAVCPTGFSCGNPTSETNNYLTYVDMKNLDAGRIVKGEWIHYNYAAKKPEVGLTRKSQISIKGESETITFNLTITVADPAGIENIMADEDVNAPAYNMAGQKVGSDAKGIVIKGGKKFIAK